MTTHVVTQGECLATIAAKHGYDWRFLYNASENTDLRLRRPNPNVLYPGDEVVIPPRDPVGRAVATGQQHTFVVHRATWVVRLRMLDHEHQRISGVTWKVDYDGAEEPLTGTTGDDGVIEVAVPVHLQRATLEAMGQVRVLEIGGLDPIARVSGVQQRLARLGYSTGPTDGIIGPQTRHAIRAFQRDHEGLRATGLLDEATRHALQAIADEDGGVPAWEGDPEVEGAAPEAQDDGGDYNPERPPPAWDEDASNADEGEDLDA